MRNSVTYRAAARPPRLSVRSGLSVGDPNVQRYRMTFIQTMEHCARLRRSGYPMEAILIDGSAPDHCVELQAEIMNSYRFVEMRYCLYSGIGMRQAYDRMQHTHGVVAMAILRTYLDASSMDKLEEILQDYPDCVVELSTYPVGVGRLNLNTIFWEVREY